MKKFKDVVMKLAENAAPELKIVIQEQLAKFTSALHTPDHPPYAAMIHNAIIELNDKRGSSEESISEYIKNQHTDLPLAHNSLLKHHLGKLCESGEIVVTGKHLYLLPGSNPTLESRVRTEKDRVTRKRKARKGRGRVGKKCRTETDKHGESHGEEHGETARFYKGNDEIILDNNEIKVDNKVNGVGELDQVVKQIELENRMLDEQSQLHEQLSHEICAPVVDSSQPEHSSPDRPPGFDYIILQSKQNCIIVQEPELISDSGRLYESETLLQVDQEQWRLQGQANCKYHIRSEGSKSASSDFSTELLTQNQQQRMDPLNSDGLQGVKSEDVKLLESHPKNLKQYGRRRKLNPMTKEKEIQDVTAELEQKTKQLDLSDLDKSSQPLPESEQQATLTSNDVDMNSKQQHIEQHDKSVSNDHIEQQGTKKVDQVVRRSQRLSKSTQTYTLSLDLLPSSQSQCRRPAQPILKNDQSSLQVQAPQLMRMDVDYVNLAERIQLLQLPAVDNIQTTKHTDTGSSESSLDQVQMVKTTKELQQHAKLRSWQKRYTSHENTQTACPGSSSAIGPTEQMSQVPLCLEYYQQPVALKESMQQQAHTKLSGTTELEADTSMKDMPTLDQRWTQMPQGRGRGRGRPPKMKLGQRSMQNP
ncbi:hypothetical protein ACET3Z_007371 [Daucus carota]